MSAFRTIALGVLSIGIVAGLCAPGIAQYYGQVQQDGASMQTEQNAGPENVMIILDASESMRDPMGGMPKIQAAKNVILQTIRSLGPNVNIGLRVYGHRRSFMGGPSFGFGFGGGMFQPGPGGYSTASADCTQSEVLVPIGTNNRLAIASKLPEIQAVGKTPITYSLRESVMKDFQGVYGKKTIILVSDGRETCSYNPCDLAIDMVRHGVDVKINTVGYGTSDRVAIDQLKCVAMSTKGKFYSANTAAELARSLNDSMQVTTSVQAKITPGP